MRGGGGGSIVNIGTMATYFAGSGTVAYGASKVALRNLTVTMAYEWARWNPREPPQPRSVQQ
jgi:NAD(P)-dependent dehydrogenase (short-subunit alcohol dehydrogenase family)